MGFSSFLESLSKLKNISLLGEDAHAKLSPPYRLALAKQLEEQRKQAKHAGVLMLFYPKNNTPHLVLILRKTYKGVHSAQVGFPGGKVEKGDTGLKDTALRETEEEIGVPKTQISIVKALSELYIPPSNFIVHPFIGYMQAPAKFIKDDTEVEAIIEVPLSEFMDNRNITSTKVPTSYKVVVEVPAFNLQGHTVWGATAMMLSELKLLLNEVL